MRAAKLIPPQADRLAARERLSAQLDALAATPLRGLAARLARHDPPA